MLGEKLRALLAWIKEVVPGAEGRTCVDAQPAMDKAWAARAGLGWIGKHTNLITRDYGSWVFLGELVLDIELQYDEAREEDHCGTCTLCIDACPTEAITEPYVVDSNKCISYATIELRDAELPADVAPNMNGWLYGCDICQDVCPWNRGIEKRRRGEAAAAGEDGRVSLADWLSRDGDELVADLDRLYVPRNESRWLRRNALVAAGNVGTSELEPSVHPYAEDEDPILRDAAEWALARIADRRE